MILRYISIFRTSLWTRAKRGLRVFVSDQGRGDHSAVHGAQHHWPESEILDDPNIMNKRTYTPPPMYLYIYELQSIIQESIAMGGSETFCLVKYKWPMVLLHLKWYEKYIIFNFSLLLRSFGFKKKDFHYLCSMRAILQTIGLNWFGRAMTTGVFVFMTSERMTQESTDVCWTLIQCSLKLYIWTS